MVRLERTGLIVPRSGLGTTRTVACPEGFGLGRGDCGIWRVSIIVNEWAQ